MRCPESFVRWTVFPNRWTFNNYSINLYTHVVYDGIRNKRGAQRWTWEKSYLPVTNKDPTRREDISIRYNHSDGLEICTALFTFELSKCNISEKISFQESKRLRNCIFFTKCPCPHPIKHLKLFALRVRSEEASGIAIKQSTTSFPVCATAIKK